MQRPWGDIPVALPVTLVALLVAQLAFAQWRTGTAQAVNELPAPWTTSALRIVGGGDEVATGRVAMLWLQSFDVQSGTSVALGQLDYGRLSGWLEALLGLDPRSQYPLQSAARIYAEVADEERSRQMLELIYRQYFADPNRRWPWLAHAAVIAKHRLRNPALALKYARALADTSSDYRIPNWARQMQWTLLEEQGEFETVQLLIGGLLESGQVTDGAERHFLDSMLERLQRERTQRRTEP